MDKRVVDYYQGELNTEERVALLKEAFVDEGLKKELIDQQHLHALMMLHSSNINKEKGEKGFSLFLAAIKTKKQKRLFLQWSKYAAIFIISFLSTWFCFLVYNGNEVVVQEAFAPVGQRAELLLSDGTKVWLNSNSRLIYVSNFGDERRVHLIGEAFFKVKKNAEKPFIVETQKGCVRALGTQFNVCSYPRESLSVLLTEGAVRVYKPNHEIDGVVMTNRQFLIERDQKFYITNQIDESTLLWKQGLYCFDNTELGVIIKKLELYFDVQIIVKKKELLAYQYTGKFRQKDGVMEILRIIRKIYPFEIKFDMDKNVITLY